MEDEQKPIVIFGRDIRKVPCLRKTFLYSISSYIGVGLATFLFTSRPAISSHAGFAAFVIVTLGYYTDCRIKYDRKKYEIVQMKEELQKAAILEGTEKYPNRKTIPKLEEV